MASKLLQGTALTNARIRSTIDTLHSPLGRLLRRAAMRLRPNWPGLVGIGTGLTGYLPPYSSGPRWTAALPPSRFFPPRTRDGHGATDRGDDRLIPPVVERERPRKRPSRGSPTVRGMTHRPTIPQPSVVHRLIRGLSAGFSTGLSLGLPVSCAGCGCWETALCPRCRELLEGEPFNVEHADAAGDLDILALTTYTGPCAPWSWGGRTARGRTSPR